MTPALFWNNAVNWAVQVAVLSGFGYLATVAFRMHSARMRLRWFQLVLGVVLLLPAVFPPARNIIIVNGGDTNGVSVVTGAARVANEPVSGLTIFLGFLAAGVVLRMIWLAVGFIRLSHHRRSSAPLEPPSSWFPEADIRVSPTVSGPVTFGVRHPVVLLPVSFQQLGEAQQDAIICHEILHIRQKDWLWMLAEEVVRSVLWFHPCIWWLTGEIRLAREQAVDAAVVELTRSRDEYVDALLTFANVVPTPFAAPAPGFVRRRHLKQRVLNILKEVHMTRTRSVFTGFAASIALAAVAWFTTIALPLRAEPQLVADTAGVQVNTNGAVLQHRSPVAYLRSADGKQAGGTVLAEVRLDDAGNVSDARILSGPDELRKPVLQSVLNWHFAKSAGAIQQVSVTFQPQAPVAVQIPGNTLSGNFEQGPSPTVKQIDVRGLSDAAKQELLASLPVHLGDALTPEANKNLRAAMRKADEHLAMATRSQNSNEVSITVGPAADLLSAPTQTRSEATPSAAGAIRVGGNVAQTKLINQPKPIYPPQAKQARVQGTVSFEATIDKEGKISNLQLKSGHPLLVQAAMQAVQQWTYQPTYLNGNPVEIVTTIDVNFTLSDTPPPAQ